MTPTQHSLNMLKGLLVLIGPLPLALALVRTSEDRERGGAHALLVMLVVWCALQAGLGVVLGSLGLYAPFPALLAEGLLLVSGIVALVLLSQRGHRAPGAFWPWLERIDPASGVLLGLIALAGLWNLREVLVNAITDYDSLAYHLPAMAEWAQKRRLVYLDQFAASPISRYPYGWEVLCALTFLAADSDLLVALPNLLAWALLGLSVYRLGRWIGAGRAQALLPVVLLLTMPIVTYNANTMHVDLPFAAMFCAGLYLLTAYGQTRRWRDLLLFLAAVSLLLGIKTSGLAYGGALVGILIVGALWRTVARLRARRRATASSEPPRPTPTSGPSWRLKVLVDVVVAALPLAFALYASGFWYVRNWVEMGNPLGHVAVQLGGWTLFPGPLPPEAIAKTTLLSVFDTSSGQDWRVLVDALDRELAAPFWLLLSQLGLLILGLFARRPPVHRGRSLGALALTPAAILLYLATPYSGDNGSHNWQVTPWIGQGLRYGFPALGLLAAVAAGGLAAVGVPGAVLVGIGLFALSTLPLYGGRMIIAGLVLLTLVGATRVVSSVLGYLRGSRWRGQAALLLIGSLAVTAFLYGTYEAWPPRMARTEGKLWGGFVGYLHREVPPNARLGYLHSHKTFLFYGPTLDREVVYVPAGMRTYDQWLSLLHAKGVDILIIGPMPEGTWLERKETAWVQQPHVELEPLFGENLYLEPLIFRVQARE